MKMSQMVGILFVDSKVMRSNLHTNITAIIDTMKLTLAKLARGQCQGVLEVRRREGGWVGRWLVDQWVLEVRYLGGWVGGWAGRSGGVGCTSAGEGMEVLGGGGGRVGGSAG